MAAVMSGQIIHCKHPSVLMKSRDLMCHFLSQHFASVERVFPVWKVNNFAPLCVIFAWLRIILQVLSVRRCWKEVLLLLYQLGAVWRWKLVSSVFIALKIKSGVGVGPQLNFVCPTHRCFVPPCLSVLSVEAENNLGEDRSLMGRCFHLIFCLFLFHVCL